MTANEHSSVIAKAVRSWQHESYRLEADARRYRWLARQAPTILAGIAYCVHATWTHIPKELDAAIDAAIESEES